MGSLLKRSTPGKPKGIISDDIVHRIDMMNDADESDQQAYKAKRRSNLGDEQLFDGTVYGDDTTEEFEASAIIILGIVLVLVLAVVGLIIVIL